MRKTIIYILVIIILGGITLYLVHERNKIYSFEAERVFRINNPEEISRIRIHHRDTIHLEKTKAGWLINELYPANEPMIKNALEILSSMEIQSQMPPDNQAIQNDFNHRAVNISLYNNKNLVKEYRLADGRQYNCDALAKLAGKQEIFAIASAGHTEVLANLMQVNLDDWLDKTLINLLPHEIESVKIYYSENTEKSFRLQVSENRFHLHNADEKDISAQINVNAIKRYLGYFQLIYFEKAIIPSHRQIDSLQTRQPFIRISVTPKNETQQDYALYRIVRKQTEPLSYDLNHCFILRRDLPKLTKAKYVELDPILKQKSYFLTDIRQYD